MTQTALSATKLILIGLLGLGLLVPLVMVGAVIADRESWQAQARREVAASWGEPQTLLGPLLVLPYRERNGDKRHLVVAPEHLATRATLAPERRRRGLFETVVYTASIGWEGAFRAEYSLPEGAEPLWPDAYLLTANSDHRVAEPPRLSWGGRALLPAAVTDCGLFESQRWPLGLAVPPQGNIPVPVSGGVALRGTGSLRVVPVGRRPRLSMAGPWASPSFIGTDLPARVSLTDDAFQAEWTGGQEAWPDIMPNGCLLNLVERLGVGVALIEPVQTYRMVNRAAKYSVMFVALCFLTYLLFELLGGVRIHLVQYGLLGASLVLFPLLLLALAEPLGFATAYAVATAMVLGQAGLFTAAVVGRAGLAAIFASILGGLFGFLYVVLSLESFSLLVGAVALFAALSLVMVVTRRVQWG